MTILTKQVTIKQLEREEGEDISSQTTLDENLVRTVLFSERKKPVPLEPKKELNATKKFLKTLIMEALNEMV